MVQITRQMEPYPDSVYAEFVAGLEEAVALADAREDAPYRMEKSFYRTQNDPMLGGYKGVSHFGSTQDNATEDILLGLGYGAMFQ